MSGLFPRRSEVQEDLSEELRLLSIDEGDADDVFSALNSAKTREILGSLYENPQTASDLATEVDTSLQNTKYHINKLSDADLIEVVDEWYSESGNEMKVYAPTNQSLVLFATRNDDDSNLRQALSRFFGAVAILGIVSVMVDVAIRAFSPTENYPTPVSADVTEISQDTGTSIIQLSPGEIIFVIGLSAIIIASAWLYLRPSLLPSEMS